MLLSLKAWMPDWRLRSPRQAAAVAAALTAACCVAPTSADAQYPQRQSPQRRGSMVAESSVQATTAQYAAGQSTAAQRTAAPFAMQGDVEFESVEVADAVASRSGTALQPGDAPKFAPESAFDTDGFSVGPPGAASGLPPGVDPSAPEGMEQVGGETWLPDTFLDRTGMSPDCCKAAPTFWYAQADVLFLERTETDLTRVSPFLSIGDFGYESSLRLTLGRQLDGLDATEFVFTGANTFQSENSVVTGADNLFSFFPTGFLPGFDFADAQSVSYQSQFTSFEWNQRQWGWDIVSTMQGFRYIHIGEELNFASVNNTPGTSVYSVKARNNLLGYQIGGDILYPLGAKTAFCVKGRLGAYINFAEQNSVIVNNGVTVVDTGDDKTDFTLNAEFGAYFTYRVHPRLTLKTGYETWFFYQLALAPDQFSTVPSAGVGGGINVNSDSWYNGFFMGAEFQW